MLALLAQAGPFGLLSLLFAGAGMILATAQLLTGRSFEVGTTLAAAVALLVGVMGSGLGLSVAEAAIAGADPEHADALWRQAVAICSTTTSLGALGAAADLVALAVVSMLRPVR